MDDLTKNVSHYPADGTASPAPIPSPKEEPSLVPAKQQKKFPKIVLLIILALLAIGVLAGRAAFTSHEPADNGLKVTTTSAPKTVAAESPFSVKGNTVVHNLNGKETVIFTNLKGVTAVRPGPDGNTIHFKTHAVPDDAEYCAQHDSFQPPTGKPWDYTMIGYAESVASCGDKAGGYLKKSEYFVYLVIDARQNGTVVVRNLKTNKKAEIGVNRKLVSGFTKSEAGKVNSYWGTPIIGKDGNQYFYPGNDSYEVNGKILVSFARLVVGVDVVTDRVLGGFAMSEPEYNVVATSFWFVSKENVPIVVIDSGWEGVGLYQAIVDMSGDALHVENIAKLDKSGFNLLDLKKITWGEKDVKITVYAEDDVTNTVRDITSTIKDYTNEAQIAAAEKAALEKLKQDTNYHDVMCMLSPGVIAGCFAAKDVVTYQYVPGGPLKKLE